MSKKRPRRSDAPERAAVSSARETTPARESLGGNMESDFHEEIVSFFGLAAPEGKGPEALAP